MYIFTIKLIAMKNKKPICKYSIVMLIDDNELDNFVNQKVIEANNFSEKIYLNTSGKSALEFLQNISVDSEMASALLPDIIFVDINMPLMDGFQFIDQFEKFAKGVNKSIKIVILTTSANPEDRNKANNYKQPIMFLNKPLTDESLLTV